MFFPPDSFAADQPAEQAEQAGLEQEDEFINPIDGPRDYLADKFVELASGIDRFFGDERNYQESNDSVFQLDLSRVEMQGGDRKLVLSGKAKVRLPATEKRLRLIVETNPEENIQEDSEPGKAVLNEKVVAPASYAAGVRFEKEKESRWHFSADAGIRLRGAHANPFARTRGSYSVIVEQWRLKLAESIFWFNITGAGESTQLDIERALSDAVLFRATSNATWLYNTKNFSLRQDLSFYQTVSSRTALLYQVSAIGASKPGLEVTTYVALIVYRYRLHRNWVFFELSPQLHFPKAEDYHSNALLNLRLEMLFNGPK